MLSIIRIIENDADCKVGIRHPDILVYKMV